jgi:hypothetical protein
VRGGDSPRDLNISRAIEIRTDSSSRCEGYSGLAPRRYCKDSLSRVQKAIRVEGTIVRCFNNNDTPSSNDSLI